MDFGLRVVGIVLLIIAAAYFAMSEIALAGSRKVRLTRMADQGDRRAQLVLNLKNNPGNFFSVVQIGINAVAILGGIVGEAVFTSVFQEMLKWIVPEDVLPTVSFLCSFVFVTLLFVMFADLIPKRVAMSCPEAVAVNTIRGMTMLIVLLKPVVWLLTWAANGIMRFFGLPLKNQDAVTSEDIVATVDAGAAAGVIAPIEQAAISNVMDLESRLVPSAMTARDCVVFFYLDDSYETITKKVSETPHDKFLVCGKSIDDVIGYVDSKELLQKYIHHEEFSLKGSGMIRPIISLPDSLTLTETLDIFKKQRIDFAMVVNEYALTMGVITLKDILWVVMGDYVSAPEEAQVVERDDGTWLVDGATPVDDIEKMFDIESLPEEQSYETMAGFMMFMLRKIPKRTDRVEYAGYRFEVIAMEGYRIDQLLMTKLPADKTEGDDD